MWMEQGASKQCHFCRWNGKLNKIQNYFLIVLKLMFLLSSKTTTIAAIKHTHHHWNTHGTNTERVHRKVSYTHHPVPRLFLKHSLGSVLRAMQSSRRCSPEVQCVPFSCVDLNTVHSYLLSITKGFSAILKSTQRDYVPQLEERQRQLKEEPQRTKDKVWASPPGSISRWKNHL